MIEQITLSHILEVIAVLVIIFEFGKWLISFGNPIVELKKRVDKHDGLFANDKERLDRMDKQLEKIGDGMEVQGKALAELLNHTITGNDWDALKKKYQELIDFYFDK